MPLNSNNTTVEERSIAEQQAKRYRSRPQNFPRPHSHLFFSPTGQILRGRRHTQRYNNSLYLKALLPLSEEELTEDYSRLLPQYESSFTRILTNNHEHMLWESFSELTEEEQTDLIKHRQCKRGSKTPNKQKKHCEIHDKHDDRLMQCIDPQIRRALRQKLVPLEFIEGVETELYEYFLDDPLVIIVFLNLTSYQRLLIHGICQYNSYYSMTCHIDENISYLMIGCNELVHPPLPLYKILQNKH